MLAHCRTLITNRGGYRGSHENISGVQFAGQLHEKRCCTHRRPKRLSERFGCGSLLRMCIVSVPMSSQLSSAIQECNREGKVTATGCRTAMRGGVNGSRVRRTGRVGMVSARPNKPLVPTRNGEVPLRAAQRRRWANEQ